MLSWAGHEQENLIAEGHRTLVFAQTQKMLNIIQVWCLTVNKDRWFIFAFSVGSIYYLSSCL